MKLLKDHPAETSAPLAVAVAWLIAWAAGIDSRDWVLAVAVVLSFVPALVTWVVDRRQTADRAKPTSLR